MQQRRTIDLSVRAVSEEDRRVTVSFSSEQPVDRWYGQEILQHDEGNMDLSRLNNIGVSLFNHNKDYVLGHIENASCDTTEKRAVCDIVFDDDPDSERVFQKVKSGTLKGTSVGYKVDVWEEVGAGKTSTNGRFAGPCYVATRWSPFEVSIVSIPADDSVGVGREVEGPWPYAPLDKQRERSNFGLRGIDFFERQLQVNKNFLGGETI
jgi:Phage head maturation protease